MSDNKKKSLGRYYFLIRLEAYDCACAFSHGTKSGWGRGAVGVTRVVSLLYIEACASSGGSYCFLIGLTAHAWAYSHNVQNLNI